MNYGALFLWNPASTCPFPRPQSSFHGHGGCLAGLIEYLATTVTIAPSLLPVKSNRSINPFFMIYNVPNN
jgi:hypothetical protein